MYDCDHLVPGVDPLLYVVGRQLAPDGEAVTEERANACQAPLDAAVDGVVELYLWVIKRERRPVVVAHEGLPSPAHNLHVFARHRVLPESYGPAAYLVAGWAGQLRQAGSDALCDGFLKSHERCFVPRRGSWA
jgi:hypothetical protein